MNITIVGAGYVGLSNAMLLAQYNEVIAIDIIKEKVDLLNAVWSMEKEDPLYISIQAMLKGAGRL